MRWPRPEQRTGPPSRGMLQRCPRSLRSDAARRDAGVCRVAVLRGQSEAGSVRLWDAAPLEVGEVVGVGVEAGGLTVAGGLTTGAGAGPPPHMQGQYVATPGTPHWPTQPGHAVKVSTQPAGWVRGTRRCWRHQRRLCQRSPMLRQQQQRHEAQGHSLSLRRADAFLPSGCSLAAWAEEPARGAAAGADPWWARIARKERSSAAPVHSPDTATASSADRTTRLVQERRILVLLCGERKSCSPQREHDERGERAAIAEGRSAHEGIASRSVLIAGLDGAYLWATRPRGTLPAALPSPENVARPAALHDAPPAKRADAGRRCATPQQLLLPSSSFGGRVQARWWEVPGRQGGPNNVAPLPGHVVQTRGCQQPSPWVPAAVPLPLNPV